ISIFFVYSFVFFKYTATTEIYTLSLHDALPISDAWITDKFLALEASKKLGPGKLQMGDLLFTERIAMAVAKNNPELLKSVNSARSEEHTSELQSHLNLVCRLLLEKKKKEEHTNI